MSGTDLQRVNAYTRVAGDLSSLHEYDIGTRLVMEASEIERRVVAALLRTVADLQVTIDRVNPRTSLVADLCIDSIRFVDLTVELEDALAIDVFPMQDWVDSQLRLERSERFLVGSLLAECARVLGAL